jgi:hypothetical protein
MESTVTGWAVSALDQVARLESNTIREKLGMGLNSLIISLIERSVLKTWLESIQSPALIGSASAPTEAAGILLCGGSKLDGGVSSRSPAPTSTAFGVLFNTYKKQQVKCDLRAFRGIFKTDSL